MLMTISDWSTEEHEAGIAEMEQEPVTNPALHCMRVFPVKNKRPLLKGWQASAPIDLKAVAEWEAKHPGCGWGASIDANTIVIDCDSDAAASALCDLGQIPATLCTLTPRGFHFWFRLSNALTVRNRVGVMPGIDVRTKGGFVVVPPSDGYEFADFTLPIADAPDWTLRLVLGEGVPVPPPKPVDKEPKLVGEMPVPVNPEPDKELTPFEEDVLSRGWEKRTAPGKVPDGRSPFALRIALEPQNVTKGTRNAALFSYLCRLRSEGKPEESIRSEAWRVVGRIPEPMGKFEVERIIANAMKFDAGAIGKNTLMEAWRTVEEIEASPGSTKWYRFLLLVEQLAEMRPETRTTILLPLVSIGKLMNVHFTQVAKWRRKTVEMGILSITSRYVRRSLAEEFAVKAGFSPLADGPAMYKVKRGRKPKQPIALDQAA